MHLPKSKDLFLVFLAIIFSIALMFAFIELPRILDLFLQQNVGFPGFDHGADSFNYYKTEVFIDALNLRLIGYVSLLLVIVFIIIGFSTRKSGWVWAGAFTLFLPVFGQFALSMFFLAGLGILRIIWLPFLDTSVNILSLAQVIYIPYWLFLWFFGLFGWYAHTFISYFFMSVGALIFVSGVLEWFKTRHTGTWIADRGIYRLSRHPQYLGWIIWSYGFLFYASSINQMKKSWSIPDSLPWLLMTMIIISICFLEELKMLKHNRETYSAYQQKTPFLFPLPRWISKIIKYPIRLISGRDQPKNISQILISSFVYTMLLILVSLFWIDFDNDNESAFSTTDRNYKKAIDSLMVEIRKPQERRQLWKHFVVLKEFGNNALEPAITLLSDPNPPTREFAADLIGSFKDESTIDTLISLLNDPNNRVRNSAIQALGEIGTEDVVHPLLVMLDTPIPLSVRTGIYRAMGKIPSKESWPVLVKALHDTLWFIQTTALTSLNQIDRERSWPFVFDALANFDFKIRRNAVTLILKHKPAQGITELERVLNDDDFETRFYARQTIRLISEQE